MQREEEVLEELRAFATERDWEQFHSPSNLASSIAIEAGELLECFQWGKNNVDAARLEVADVLTYSYFLAMQLGALPSDLILEKLRTTRDKYPIEKSRGSSARYDELPEG